MPKGRRPSPILRYYLDYDTDFHKEVFMAFRANIIKEIVSNPEGCTLPLKLGFIKIIGNRRAPSADMSTYEALNGDKFVRGGKRSHYTNYHTDGLTFKPVWYSTVVGVHEETVKPGFFNSDIYIFKAAYPLRQALLKK